MSKWLGCVIVVMILLSSMGKSAPMSEKPVKGYVVVLPAESESAREARHAKVAERRKGPAVIVHRGASAFAPENTLEAYAAAMDYGADGCEIDPRRTADGVIVLFHDDMLENLMSGFGSVNQLTYYELLCLKRRSVYGTATSETRIPTLASFLALARQRAMLVHLDLKEPGMADDIAEMLEKHDMWESIVAINTQNAGDLLTNPKIKLLSYKAPGMWDDRSDVDVDVVKAALAKPGDMIIVDDPRVAARVLGRPAYRPVPIPGTLRKDWSPRHAPISADFQASRYVASLAREVNSRSADDLSNLLDCSESGRADTDGDDARRRPFRKKMLARAWAAERLADLGKKTDAVVRLLEYQVKHRSMDRDWRYHGVDGASAVRALASLRATESVPMLVDVFVRTDPQLSKVANPEYPDTPTPFLDWRMKSAIVRALGDLRCDASKRALLGYLALDEESARKICFPMYADATRSLMKQRLSVDEIRKLLQSPRRDIRGTAILECLDHPSKERTKALEVVLWALDLPRARHH